MKPSPTDSVVSRICRLIVRIVALPFIPLRGFAKEWFPYLYHIIGTSVRYVSYVVVSLPVLALALVVASLPLGGEPVLVENLLLAGAAVREWSSVVRGDLHYLALAVASYYLLAGVLHYRPKDEVRRDYRWDLAPKVPYMWEHTLNVLIPASPVSILFTVLYFEPSLIGRVPYGLYGLTGVLFAIAGVLLYWFAKQSYNAWVSKNEKHHRRAKERGSDWAKLEYVFWVALTGGVVSGFIPSLLGRPLVETLFYAHLLVTLRMLRNVRWLLYQDHDAFVDIKPHLWFWGGLSRVPAVYLGVILAEGGFASVTALGLPVLCTYAPLVAFVAYLSFRYSRLNGEMRGGRIRSETMPDTSYVNIDEYARSQARMLFGNEIADAMKPESRMWEALSRVEWSGGMLPKDVSALEDTPTVKDYDYTKTKYIRNREYSTYKRRATALAHMRAVLNDVQRAAEESSNPRAADILSDVEETREHIREASKLNREVGTLGKEALNRFL